MPSEPSHTSILISDLMPHLGKDDDVALWERAIAVVIEEFALHLDEHIPCYLEVGVCSHWLRPHQSRWTAAGGFAWPSGYMGGTGHNLQGLPEFDWSELFRWESGALKQVKKYSDRRRQVMRVTFPARTARHQQAVLHVLWYPGKTLVFLGFRNVGGEWKLVATSEKIEGVVAK